MRAELCALREREEEIEGWLRNDVCRVLIEVPQ